MGFPKENAKIPVLMAIIITVAGKNAKKTGKENCTGLKMAQKL